MYPAWDGGGTVKLVIINSEYGIPSNELIQAVKDVIDPDSNTGAGYGLAPIGHTVTVEGAVEERISFMSNIVYQAGYSFERCREDIFQAIDAYFMN